MKIKMSSVFLTLGALAAMPSAFAGSESHGGQGVVCKDAQGNTTSVQIADYYEGMSTLGTSLDTGPTTTSYMDVVKYVLGRFEKIDPVAAQRYLSRATTFESETLYSATPLTPIDDAHDPVQAQPGCVLAQFALQNYPLKPLQKRYVVDQSIWNAADVIAKAGLVLHEVIYTDALSLGQTTSDNTRYFNYVISSTAINGMDMATYSTIVAAAGFNQQSGCLFSGMQDSLPVCLSGGAVAENYPFTLKDGQTVMAAPAGTSFWKDNSGDTYVSSLFFVSPTQLQVYGYSFNAKAVGLNLDKSINDVVLSESTTPVTLTMAAGQIPFVFDIGFYPDGKISSGDISGTFAVLVGGVTVTIADHGAVTFDENGSILSVPSTQPFTSPIKGQPFQFQSASAFFPNGQVQTASIKGGQTITDAQGKSKNLETSHMIPYFPYFEKLSYEVTFDANGNVIACSPGSSTPMNCMPN